ncbi:FadR/GntR family transcriptional regulator [Feifania hominis]|uniref:FadR family transcriptional regulator n=1 Tax=Feifania hominis TaxID=2763660 RepID=A0A926DCN0_9FIRM|nr:FadR/GntR family transcriptional regulator [Feifania hominis]MBC8535376.1 FadR family transcriptional regulator [Feifania hominis]
MDQNILQSYNEKMTQDMYTNLDSVTKKSITSTLLDKLTDLIMDETLKPGYVFPNENEMCKQLGIGRSTLRETQSALAAMGFITRTKAGTTVNDRLRIISSIPLRYIFKNSDLDEIMEYRIMLESQNAYLAAKFADDRAIEDMEGIIAEMRENAGSDVTRLSQLDFNFHFAIATATNNSLLKNTLAAVAGELERSSYSGYYINPTKTISTSIDFHEQILSAIRAHDQTRAKHAMRNHIKDIYTNLRKVMYE